MKVLTKQIVFTQYILTIGLLSVCLFLYGFFPIKSSSDVFSSEKDFPTELFNIKFHRELLYRKSVKKTVIMVIDGIRVDFVNEENMPYTSAVLSDTIVKSCLLTARVSAPTVTLPRVKAIVTGTVSSFIDVVLNFDTKELKIDNIVHQATQRNKKVVFYGDDTWVRLFPRQFARSDGTSSFYVNDYSEVDDNVTRHLASELARNDWDLMILHYLGLDHIGHIEGPKSSLIQPKLQEMDGIIARLHNYLSTQGDGLLIVCGDHGMKDSGSHGGVSLPEVLVPVIALGVSCPNHDKQEMLQVDLAATLSVLWAAPLPADSIGVAVPALLSHLSPAQRNYASLYNTQQLAANFLRNRGTKSHESYKLYKEAREAHFQWLTNGSSVTDQRVEALYQAALLGMSRHLSNVMANYDVFALLASMCLLLQIVIILGLRLLNVYQVLPSTRLSLLLGITILVAATVSVASSSYNLSTLPGVVVFSTSAVFVLQLVFIYYNGLHLQLAFIIKMVISFKKMGLGWSPLHWLLLVGTVLFSLSLFSSSFIEEEHQLWYFLWVTLGVVCVLRLRVPMLVAVLVIHRALRTLNQTGDQWAHLPDLSDWLIKPENKTVLTAFFLTSIILVLLCCCKLSSRRFSRLVCISAAVCIYQHKAAHHQVVAIGGLTTSGTMEARLCLLLICLQLVVTSTMEGVVISWVLLVSLLLRLYNVILPPALYLCSHAISHTHSSPYVVAVIHHWLGAVFFFYQGNSNSLASVDVAAGYVGMEEYNIGVVAVLLLSHTYAMPILAYLFNLLANVRHARGWSQRVEESCRMIVFLQLLHVLTVFISATVHRYHLFVWTVFSPKLLYVAVQTSVAFVLVSITNICIYCSQRPNNC